MKRRLLSLLVGGLVACGVGAVQAQDTAVGVGTQMSAAKADAKVQITAEQRAMLAEKLARIDLILRAAQSDTLVPMTAEKAKWMRESLYGLSLAQVKAIAPSGSSQATTDAIVRSSKATTKALGSPSSDLVYRPWPPCRYIDTRNVGGKITGARGYDTFDAGSVYGGAPLLTCNPRTLAGVSDENDIAAFALNVTIVDTSTAASPGFMTVRPAGSTNQTALVNWTVSSAGFQLGNAAVVTADQTGAGNEIELFTSGAVHAIVDLAGAFVPPALTALSCTTVTGVSTPFPGSSSNTLAPAPACPAGRTAVSLECESSTNSSRVLGFNSVGCFFANDSIFASTVRTDTKCCSVPGI